MDARPENRAVQNGLACVATATQLLTIRCPRGLGTGRCAAEMPGWQSAALKADRAPLHLVLELARQLHATIEQSHCCKVSWHAGSSGTYADLAGLKTPWQPLTGRQASVQEAAPGFLRHLQGERQGTTTAVAAVLAAVLAQIRTCLLLAHWLQKAACLWTQRP